VSASKIRGYGAVLIWFDMTKKWLVLSSFSAKQNPQQSCGFFVSSASEVYFRKRLETKTQMREAQLGFALQVPRLGSTQLIPIMCKYRISSESDWKQKPKCAQRIWVLLCRFPARDQRS
jgi:hypothetical protein